MAQPPATSDHAHGRFANGGPAIVFVEKAADDHRPWYGKPPNDAGVLIAPILALIVALIAWRQWRHDQKWRRDESRSRRRQDYDQRLASFYTPETRAALSMLFNYETKVKLAEWRDWELVRWPEVELALVPPSHRVYLFEDKISQIRDCFFSFMEAVGRLSYLVEKQLVTADDVDHVVRPLLERIASQDSRFCRNLRVYIQFSQMRRVATMFERYGIALEPRLTHDLASLEDDLVTGNYGAFQACPWGPESFQRSAAAAERRAKAAPASPSPVA